MLRRGSLSSSDYEFKDLSFGSLIWKGRLIVVDTRFEEGFIGRLINIVSIIFEKQVMDGFLALQD